MLHHRALADPSRVRLLDAPPGDSNGRSRRHELAGALGLHPNTVRAHLTVLEEAELVVSSSEHARARRDARAGSSLLCPKRPRRSMRCSPPLSHPRSSRFLTVPTIAAAAGRSWGRVLVERLEPGRKPDEVVCVERIAGLLRRRGFAPETTPGQLVMHRCPFRELAERYPRVVCSFHAGLIDGALEELGAPVVLDRLDPWVTPSTCIARFAPRASGVVEPQLDPLPGSMPTAAGSAL